MAGFNSTSKKNKNKCAIRLVSSTTGAMLGWFHPVDQMARAVFEVSEASEISAEKAASILPAMIAKAEVQVTDMLAPIVAVAPDKY